MEALDCVLIDPKANGLWMDLPIALRTAACVAAFRVVDVEPLAHRLSVYVELKVAIKQRRSEEVVLEAE